MVEVSKKNTLGNLFLSNFQLLFKPNQNKLNECVRYTVPYGYITKMVEKTNNDRTDCLLHILCKDERQFKFKFEGNGPMFTQYCKVIRRYAL